MTGERINPTFAALLDEACSNPGRLSDAFRAFHNYSIGNAMAAMSQCMGRGILPGPIATFRKWKELGRHVTKGQKAIWLCMPITCKGKKDAVTSEDARGFTRFIWRPFWFVLSQTDGADYVPPAVVEDWDRDRMLSALNVTLVPFTHTNGNALGYATERNVAVSPLCDHPFRTLVHEVAHVILGHTDMHGPLWDGDQITKADAEVEAEGTAYIVASVMGCEPDRAEASRGYIQAWLRSSAVSERMAARMFKTADSILKAGRAVQDAIAERAA